MKVTINSEGTIQAVAPDDMSVFDSMSNNVDCRRASHVESIRIGNRTKWTADLSPVGGPKELGIFETRKDAINAEVAYLEARLGNIKWEKST
jgi:hypothetical protein